VRVDPENEWLFEDSPGTGILETFEILAIVQEATDRYSSALVENLFLNTHGANARTVSPERVVGWTWFEFQTSAIQTGRDGEIPINPLGLIKNGKTSSCPPFDTRIEKGDSISVIAYPDFDWDSFERRMVEGKA